MRPTLFTHAPTLAAVLQLLLAFDAKQAESFVCQQQAKSTTRTCLAGATAAAALPGARPVGGSAATTASQALLCCTSAAVAGSAGIPDTMASESEMPELKVVRVDEVPTVNPDPVDPKAREQAKVPCCHVLILLPCCTSANCVVSVGLCRRG